MKLVQQVLNGNVDSFNIIVNKYELPILRFVYNIIKDREASEDIAQEVFITVYNKLYMFKRDYKFSNWVFQIAKNKCIDYIRKYKRVYEANMEDVPEIISEEATPEQSMEFRETKKQVERFVNSLGEIDKHIIVLRYSNENTTFADIGEILSMSESAVKRRYYKAREKYKDFILEKEKGCK